MKYRIKFEVACEDCCGNGDVPNKTIMVTCSSCDGTGFQEDHITRDVNEKQQNLITALKLGVISWFKFFEEWRKTDED